MVVILNSLARIVSEMGTSINWVFINRYMNNEKHLFESISYP